MNSLINQIDGYKGQQLDIFKHGIPTLSKGKGRPKKENIKKEKSVKITDEMAETLLINWLAINRKALITPVDEQEWLEAIAWFNDETSTDIFSLKGACRALGMDIDYYKRKCRAEMSQA